MTWIRGVSSLIVVAALAGCATTQPNLAPTEPEIVVKTRTIDTSCTTFKPIYPTKTDVLADSTAQQIVDHDKAGAARCGWKPPAK